MALPNRQLVQRLRAIHAGDRVHYSGWRGDRGSGTLVMFLDRRGREVGPGAWGVTKLDGVLVKRDFSADDGTVFFPLADDGDSVSSDEMVAEEVIRS